jgi:L-threonylcarbamoyladenylate synthase
MKILKDKYVADLEYASGVLRKGGTILYPTDTVWGLGCDATCADAVRRLYEIKRRADAKAMLVLLDSYEKLGLYVDHIPAITYRIACESERPVTFIFRNGRGIADELIAGDGSIGIRITKEAFSSKLCRNLGHPLVSTSANISGETAPASFEEISREVINAVDYVVKYRQEDTSIATPSRIIRIEEGEKYTVIRE